ncbi:MULTISPECIES: GntR family transcriptional regulator [unclassified Pseudonocardia]|uniref:GntR family transcriptional regulator n=1 Tax=unclassified Pseudonocardia TaxID=2619320 RepID=UPI00049286F8|nr:GntR family transcriptional regulator [Pseudonocardia sp. Ae707_Ps1]
MDSVKRSQSVRPAAFRDLADALRSSIRHGEYRDGRRLPTEAELAERHSLSRNTVRRAMQELVAEGAIYRVPGRGTFVAEGGDHRFLRPLGTINDLFGLAADTSLEILTPLHRCVDVAVAGRLRLDHDSLFQVTARRLHGDEPISYSILSMTPELATLLGDVEMLTTVGATSATPIMGLADDRLPGLVAGADQSVTVSTPPPDAAEAIELAPDLAALRIDRMYLGAQDVPLALTINWYHPDRFTYRTRLWRS